MSPFATSVGFPPPAWYREYFYPMMPNPLTQGATTPLGTLYAVQKGWPFDQSTRNTVAPLLFASSTSSASTTSELRTLDGMYAHQFLFAAGGVARTHLDRQSWWTPALSEAVAPGGEDDEAHRIGWLRVYLDSNGSVAAGPQDRLGFSVIPDDGTVSSAIAFAPIAAGGFGVYKVAGTNDWRYASYSAAGALLEAIALTPTYAGWHTVDFIIRQAVRGDASTPWLTVRHDGTDVVTERPFGHALLAAPLAIRPNASNWSFHIGGSFAAAPGVTSLRYAYHWRQGRFHPDGYPQR